LSKSNEDMRRRGRRMVRCPSGHVFDAAASDVCPTCGLSVAHDKDGSTGSIHVSEPDPTPVPHPGWLKPVLIGGAALLVVVAIVAVLRGSAKDENGNPAISKGPPTHQSDKAAPHKSAEVTPDVDNKAAQKSTAVTPGAGDKTAPDRSADLAPGGNKKPEGQPLGKVERWQTVLNIGGKNYVCVNVTQPDGRYRLGDGCPPPLAGETGRTTINADGSWAMRSDSGRVDFGTIEKIDADRFIAHSAAGSSVLWTRVKTGGSVAQH
jgi:hypothetical protein